MCECEGGTEGVGKSHPGGSELRRGSCWLVYGSPLTPEPQKVSALQNLCPLAKVFLADTSNCFPQDTQEGGGGMLHSDQICSSVLGFHSANEQGCLLLSYLYFHF